MYKKDKDYFVHFRISQFDKEKLETIAYKNKLSVSQFCRNIILIYLSKELSDANEQSNKHNKL